MAKPARAPTPAAGALRRRLQWLMAARLGLVLGAFGLVVGFIGVGREGAETLERGLYGTLVVAFAASLLYALALPFVRRLPAFGALQLASDVAVVTSLVCWSGGGDSFFGFLYLPITLFGAMLFDRRGAYGSAALSSAGYALALFGAEHFRVREIFGGYAPGLPLLALWVVQTSALLLVALLSSALARELRIAGEALEESATDLERLRRLHERTVESLTSGLLTSDGQGRVTSFNPEAERITGFPEAEVLGLPVDEVLPGVEELLLGPGDAAADSRLRLRLTHPSREGGERHLGLAGSVLRAGSGKPEGHVVIFQDVTDVVAMEHDLRRSERLAAAGQLAADMAHEIRNPLAAISGSIEMLCDGLGGPEGSPEDRERHRLGEIVVREVERLNRLISDFLGYARPAAARPVAVPLAPVVDEVMGLFEASPAAEGVRTRVQVPPDLAVHADPRQFRQLLWNLVLNAAQALEGQGDLEIVAHREATQGASPADRKDEKEAGDVEIAISDTGVGIPPDVLERVFDPFFTTKRGGTGLGLATVHRVVEANGGSVRAESQVGQGTCFRIRLPGAEGSE